MLFAEVERISTAEEPPEASAGMESFVRPLPHTQQQVAAPVPSADSAMAVWREITRTVDSPALAESMAAEEASTAEAAGDSLYEVIETMKQQLLNVIPFALTAMWIIGGACQAVAQQPAQPAFLSAAEASESLFQAVQSNNEQVIANILGGPTELTTSHDPGQDKVDRELFVRKYQEMHRLKREADGSVTLYIGAENWPFPIPITGKANAWRFDADAGAKEVMFRRIGENELAAIAMCHEFAAGKKEHGVESNAANREDGGNSGAVRGYYFRELRRSGTGGKTTGGLALIAYPAEYRSSGVMTFIVTESGVVYEKDLGPNTSGLATAMATFRKGRTWHAAAE